jgi:pyruvate/2-oxoglutarate dehydrogenase complex dihydrolipoamide acyltransferase (E2) component
MTDHAIERLAHITLGMATDTERRLPVAAIRGADKSSLHRFGIEIRDLLDRAGKGRSLP